MTVRVQEADFDLGAELAALRKGRVDIGALVTFTGLVRDVSGSLDRMVLEHYPGMTEKALETIETDARVRWELSDALIIHRYGSLLPGDQIMMVAAAAPHRRAAFEAADFMMDYLKSRAPFWKSEEQAGDAQWVAATSADEDALDRWTPKR